MLADLDFADGEDWRPVGGQCSRGVGSHDIEAYNEGLAERQRRGWSQP